MVVSSEWRFVRATQRRLLLSWRLGLRTAASSPSVLYNQWAGSSQLIPVYSCTSENGKSRPTVLSLDPKFLYQLVIHGRCEDLAFCRLNNWRQIFRWPHLGDLPFWELFPKLVSTGPEILSTDIFFSLWFLDRSYSLGWPWTPDFFSTS